jgi:penicillin-binding protein 1A
MISIATSLRPSGCSREQAADYMNQMLTRVPYVGTARRAAVDGVLTGGKTGTTQAYRDAWFCGYTGNFTAAVWYGNDDYTSSNRMTGGSLPAMTFKRLMDYAHQDIELRAIPGVDRSVPGARRRPLVASAQTDANGNALPQSAADRARSTARSTDLLRGLMDKLRECQAAQRAERLAAAGSQFSRFPTPPNGDKPYCDLGNSGCISQSFQRGWLVLAAGLCFFDTRGAVCAPDLTFPD